MLTTSQKATSSIGRSAPARALAEVAHDSDINQKQADRGEDGTDDVQHSWLVSECETRRGISLSGGNPLGSDVEITGVLLNPQKTPATLNTGQTGRTAAHERIKDRRAF
jgi:hypothetical protein